MAMLNPWLLVAIIAVVVPFQQATAATGTPKRELALARDYVLAACLIERYRATPLEAEAQTWAAGLIESGTLAIGAYAALAKLVKRAAAPSLEPNGVKLNIAACMDLIHAPGFDAILRKTLAPYLRTEK